MNELSNNTKSVLRLDKGFWIAIIICIAIVAGTFSSVFSYVALAIAVVAIALMPQEDSLGIMMMIMPFANIFKSAPGTQSFFTYLMLFYVLRYIVKSRFMNRGFLISMFLLAVYLIAQMTISMNILRTIKFVANILFIYLAVNSETSHHNKKIYLCYIIGLLISSSVVALNISPNLVDYVIAKEELIANEQTARFAGMYGDPNYYSVNIIISLCLLVILNHRKELSAIPAIGLAVLMVLFAGLTASKSAFLMLIVPLLLLLYSKMQKKNYFLFVCVAIIGSALVFQALSGKIEIFSSVLSRFDEAADAESLTTGRSYIWSNYMSYLKKNQLVLWFGRGLGAEILNTHAAHNTYIDMLYYLGIVGTAFLIAVFKALTKIKRNTAKTNLLNYSGWICVAIMYFFLSELFYFDWAFHIVIAMYILKMNMNQGNEADNSGEIYLQNPI